MAVLFLSFFRWVRLFGSGHQGIVLENLALRQQLAIYKRRTRRPRLTGSDRWFWIVLADRWKDWRRALVVVHPDTVVRWQRQRFRGYWTDLSRRSRGKSGRPPVSRRIRELIQTMATTNGLWRAPRIHGELLKLGIEVSERTVSRVLRTIERPPSQTWKTFLKNHLQETIGIDFFTVPTLSFKVLFVLVVLEHRRRKVLHFGVTEHPTAQWTAQQVVEAFADRQAAKYLIRDRDGIYGFEFRRRMESLGIREVVISPQSPWQNGVVERLIGSIRRECLNHVVIFGAWHLRRMLSQYFSYYHHSRTHLALGKDAPESRVVMRHGKIVALPAVGGLHHRYERRAA